MFSIPNTPAIRKLVIGVMSADGTFTSLSFSAVTKTSPLVNDAPTERDMNEHFLTVNDWKRADISGADAWEDPIGGGAYEFENALAIQSMRDLRDDSEGNNILDKKEV
jgi:hypothetical protein